MIHIVPATAEHMRLAARNLRPMDRAEIEGRGEKPRHLLHRLYRQSAFSRAAIVDGEVAAVWGMTGALLDEDGSPWLFTTPAVERQKLEFFRETRRQIDDMLKSRRRLSTYVLAAYTQSTRFFAALGFKIGPPQPIGVGGTLYRLMVRERAGEDRRPVVIYALPRSRTKWLSAFLSYGDWQGWHEPGQHFRATEDIYSWASQDCTVTADTTAAPWWRLISETRPDARVLVVRRPVVDVVDSLMRLDMRGVHTFDRGALTAHIERLDHKLDQIERRVPDVLSVRFSDLQEEETCAAVFERCLPYAHDRVWWRKMAGTNLQCDLPSLIRYQKANWTQIDRLVSACKQETLRIIRRRTVRSVSRDEVTIQTEDFATFWRDGQRLFAAHAAEVGPREGAMLNPNIQMALALEKAGLVQILTARYVGRMVGYLVTLISPTLEDVNLVNAAQNTFFISPEFRGIGARMLRVSFQLLSERGIGEAVLKAGIRGDGPRLGGMFTRFGAQEVGRLYAMKLKAA